MYPAPSGDFSDLLNPPTLFSVTSVNQTATVLSAHGLLCDLLAFPELTTIATLRPTFGWAVAASRPEPLAAVLESASRLRGNDAEAAAGAVLTARTPAQAAYQIRVAATEAELLAGENLLWDSGRVASADSLNITYAGKPLTWGQSACWSVRLWAAAAGATAETPDAAGATAAQPGNWAAVQRFSLSAEQPAEAVSSYPLQTVRLQPELIATEADGSLFVDFGREAFAWLEVHVEHPREGEILTLDIGEKLLGQGDADTTGGVDVAKGWGAKDGADAAGTDKSNWRRIDREPPTRSLRYEREQIVLKAGVHSYTVAMKEGEINHRPASIKLPPHLPGVMPLRYVEAAAQNPAQTSSLGLSFTQVRVQYVFDTSAACFRSNSPQLDAIWDICHYSMLATSFAGYYVDGDRERIPYEADAYINQIGHYSVDREFSLARRTHEYLLEHPTWPTEWKQFSILIAWADYEATADARSLERSYAVLEGEKLLLQYAREDGLLITGNLRELHGGRMDCGDLVDWPPFERDGYDFCLINTVVNAFHYRNLVLMARIAAVLGRADDAARYGEMAQRTYAAFNAKLWSEALGCYVDGEGSEHAAIHANLFALAFGLVPAERQARVVAYIRSRGMACSVYAAQFLLDGLFEAGEADYALSLILSDGVRSWNNMLAKGATITWEAWDQSFKPNQDWNHAWGAAPGNVIARYVLGVRPLKAGYAKVRIAPQLGTLTEAEGVVPTIRGSIRVRAWKDAADASRTHVQVLAPANIEVQIG